MHKSVRALKSGRGTPIVRAEAAALERRPSASIAESVADPANGEDRSRAAGTCELAPQVADIDIHDVRGRVVLIAPYRAQDLLTREHPSAVAYQIYEQLELRSGQRHLGARAAHLARKQIHLDVTTFEHRGRRLRRYSQLRTYARQELSQGERLHEIVDRPGIQAGDTILDLPASG